MRCVILDSLHVLPIYGFKHGERRTQCITIELFVLIVLRCAVISDWPMLKHRGPRPRHLNLLRRMTWVNAGLRDATVV